MPSKPWSSVAVLGLFIAGSTGCGGEADHPVAVRAPDFLVERTGGTTAAREFRGRPFNQSARSLNNSEFARFGRGALTFDAHLTADGGLGPVFNEDSCLSCHLDGETEVDREPGRPGPGLLLRLSVPGATATGAPLGEPTYGGQLQDRALAGATREGLIDIAWTEVSGRYPDGTRYSLRRPTYSVGSPTAGPVSPAVLLSARIAPPMTGMGLLEAIPEAKIVAAADPDDVNTDGISGRTNRVWDDTLGAGVLGRFGWKAGQPTVRQQTVGAMANDMGFTTPDQPDPCHGQGSACSLPAQSAPEMSATDLADQVFYNRTIAVPIARRVDDPSVARGANTFVDLGCAACHTTTWTTGHDEVVGLSDQTIHPFTDLLLHDMGDGLADGRPEFEATGREWRTAPLWGLGRRKEVTGFDSLLHDGRARGPEEAILWHGGEATAAKTAFVGAPRSARQDLLAFLGAL